MRVVLKNLKSKIMHGNSAGRINIKIMSKEGAVLWRLKRVLRAENGK